MKEYLAIVAQAIQGPKESSQVGVVSKIGAGKVARNDDRRDSNEQWAIGNRRPPTGRRVSDLTVFISILYIGIWLW